MAEVACPLFYCFKAVAEAMGTSGRVECNDETGLVSRPGSIVITQLYSVPTIRRRSTHADDRPWNTVIYGDSTVQL